MGIEADISRMIQSSGMDYLFPSLLSSAICTKFLLTPMCATRYLQTQSLNQVEEGRSYNDQGYRLTERKTCQIDLSQIKAEVDFEESDITHCFKLLDIPRSEPIIYQEISV